MSEVTIFFGNKKLKVDKDKPLAIALMRKGIFALTTSIKYYRPRGVKSLSVFDRSTTLRIDGIPHINPSTIKPKEGMRIEPPKKKPFLLKIAGGSAEVGFQHKPLIRSPFIWRIVKKFVTKYVNLPKTIEIPEEKLAPIEPPEEKETEVLVIGGGLSGIISALEIAKKGHKVLLLEAEEELGGRTKLLDIFQEDIGKTPSDLLQEKISELKNNENIEVLTKTVFIGTFEDGLLAYHYEEPAGGKLYTIKTKAIIIATGSTDLPCIYENNDLPGTVSPPTILRLFLEGVPMERVAILGLTWYSSLVSHILGENGVKVYLLLKKDKLSYPWYREHRNVEVIENVEDVKVTGKNRVRGIIVKARNKKVKLKVDFVVYGAMENADLKVAGQAKIPYVFVDGLGFVPIHNEYLETPKEGYFVAGGASGSYVAGLKIIEARLAALSALAYLGDDVSAERDRVLEEYKSALEKYGFAKMKEKVFLAYKGETIDDKISDVPTMFTKGFGGYKFLCFCEDIKLKDVAKTVKDLGMDRFEMLKRYTGVATGRCQGRACMVNTSMVMAYIMGKSPNYVGLMRIRPPILPVPLRVYVLGVGDVE